jgi:hypothetical protein
MSKPSKTDSDQGTTTEKPAEQPKKKRKPPPTAWKSGQSGNPKGRPKSGESLSEAVRAHVTPKALIDRMKWLADNAESEMVRFHAVNWLADRGHGKAPQEVVISKKNPFAGKVKGLSIAQLEVIATIDDELFELEGATDIPEPDGSSGVN